MCLLDIQKRAIYGVLASRYVVDIRKKNFPLRYSVKRYEKRSVHIVGRRVKLSVK